MSSPLHLFALCVLVLFIKMLGISCYQGFFRLRHRAFTNPEDAGFFQRPANAQELLPVSRAAKAGSTTWKTFRCFSFSAGCAWRWTPRQSRRPGCLACSPSRASCIP